MSVGPDFVVSGASFLIDCRSEAGYMIIVLYLCFMVDFDCEYSVSLSVTSRDVVKVWRRLFQIPSSWLTGR